MLAAHHMLAAHYELRSLSVCCHLASESVSPASTSCRAISTHSSSFLMGTLRPQLLHRASTAAGISLGLWAVRQTHCEGC